MARVMGSESFYEMKVDGKWIYGGTITQSSESERQTIKYKEVELHNTEDVAYQIHIGLSMLSSCEGGDWDSDDTVFADIWATDGERLCGGRDTFNQPPHPKGSHAEWHMHGCTTGVHFGDNLGDESNQGPGFYVGRIHHNVVVRLVVNGDDWAAASYSIREL